jgi:hypothetical protein
MNEEVSIEEDRKKCFKNSMCVGGRIVQIWWKTCTHIFKKFFEMRTIKEHRNKT